MDRVQFNEIMDEVQPGHRELGDTVVTELFDHVRHVVQGNEPRNEFEQRVYAHLQAGVSGAREGAVAALPSGRKRGILSR